MQINQVVAHLLELPELIANAEMKVFEAHNELLEAKATLQDEEADCILEEKIDGKNQISRDAQLRKLTKEERFMVSQAELKYREFQIEANRLRNEFISMQHVARLLAGNEK